jgi:hypothetical protein
MKTTIISYDEAKLLEDLCWGCTVDAAGHVAGRKFGEAFERSVAPALVDALVAKGLAARLGLGEARITKDGRRAFRFL